MYVLGGQEFSGSTQKVVRRLGLPGPICPILVFLDFKTTDKLCFSLYQRFGEAWKLNSEVFFQNAAGDNYWIPCHLWLDMDNFFAGARLISAYIRNFGRPISPHISTIFTIYWTLEGAGHQGTFSVLLPRFFQICQKI